VTEQNSTQLNAWLTSFMLDVNDIQHINHYLLEIARPQSLDNLISAVLANRLEQANQKQQARNKKQMSLYRPGQTYEAGQQLLFPLLENATGKVLAVRAGNNPDIGTFNVIQVQLSDGSRYEFASNLPEHPLNQRDFHELAENELPFNNLPEAHEMALPALRATVQSQLMQLPDFICLSNTWFLKQMLLEINEFHLNLVEALLDMANGGPLRTTELLPHLGLNETDDLSLLEFSLNYVLSQDDRFDEVGPKGEVMWYLKAKEPAAVLLVPPRLQMPEYTNIPTIHLPEALERLVKEINDEWDDCALDGKPTSNVDIFIPYHHLTSGTLPLNARTSPLFPSALSTQRVRFSIIDGNTGQRFSGWVVRPGRFVYGLAPLYEKYGALAGALVNIAPGSNPDEVVIRLHRRNKGADWIRTIQNQENQLRMTMLRQGVSVKMLDEVAVAVASQAEADALFERSLNRTVERVVEQSFRELVKLSQQGSVHATTLYSTVNTVKRLTARQVFSVLVNASYCEPVGDAYWRLKSEGGD